MGVCTHKRNKSTDDDFVQYIRKIPILNQIYNQIESSDQNPLLQIKFGKYLYRLGRFQNALEYINKGLARVDGDSDIYYILYKLYQHSQSIEKATKALQTAYIKSPCNVELLSELTNLFIKQQMYSDAIQHLKQAFKNSPESKNIVLIIADCYYLQKCYPQSIKWYQKLITTSVYSSQAFFGIANSYMLMQRYSDATAVFLQAIQIHGGISPIEYYAGLCESYNAQKKLLKAVDMVIQIETIDEKCPYCINNRLLTIVPTIEISKMIIEYKCKRYQNAIKMAQQISPYLDYNICHYIIAKALYYIGEFEKAAKEIENTLAKASEDFMTIPIYLLMKYKLDGLMQKITAYCDTGMQSVDHTEIALMVQTHTAKKSSQMDKKVSTNSIEAIENIISTRSEYAQTLIMAANQGVSQSQIKGMLSVNNKDIKLGL